MQASTTFQVFEDLKIFLIETAQWVEHNTDNVAGAGSSPAFDINNSDSKSLQDDAKLKVQHSRLKAQFSKLRRYKVQVSRFKVLGWITIFTVSRKMLRAVP